MPGGAASASATVSGEQELSFGCQPRTGTRYVCELLTDIWLTEFQRFHVLIRENHDNNIRLQHL
jgi:hypothetical protein